MRYLSSLAILMCLLNFLSCRTVSSAQDAESQVSDIVTAPSSVLVSLDSLNACYDELLRDATVRDIYEFRDGRPIWVADTAITSLADSMVRFIRRLDYYGLEPADYHLTKI